MERAGSGPGIAHLLVLVDVRPRFPTGANGRNPICWRMVDVHHRIRRCLLQDRKHGRTRGLELRKKIGITFSSVATPKVNTENIENQGFRIYEILPNYASRDCPRHCAWRRWRARSTRSSRSMRATSSSMHPSLNSRRRATSPCTTSLRCRKVSPSAPRAVRRGTGCVQELCWKRSDGAGPRIDCMHDGSTL